MRRNGNDSFDIPVNDDPLETADAVARAAHIWIRSLCLNEMQEQDDRYSLARGLIAGLCERLALDARIRELVAYVYTLLNNEGSQALAVSRTMLDHAAPITKPHAYARGRSEAARIVEMLAGHDQNT